MWHVHVHVDGEKRTNIIRTEGQLPAHLTVALTVAKSSSAPIMAVIADTSRLWLIVGFSDTAQKIVDSHSDCCRLRGG